MSRRQLMILLSLVMISVSAPSGRTGGASEEEVIFTVVFDYLFDHNGSGLQNKAWAYYISIEGRDPCIRFFVCFANNRPLVKPKSDAILTPRRMGSEVSDRITKHRGTMFDIKQCRWLSKHRVRVVATFYEANLSSAGYEFVLERREGKWIVESVKGLWVS